MKTIYIINYIANKDGNTVFFENKETAESYFNDTLKYIKKVNKNKKDTDDFIDFFKIELSKKYTVFNDIKQLEILYNFYTNNTNCIELWDFMEQIGDAEVLQH